MYNWNKEIRKIRKLARKYAKKMKKGDEERKRFDWASLFVVTPLAKALLGATLAGVLLVFFVYREDKGRAPPATYAVEGTVVVLPDRQPPGAGMIQFRPVRSLTYTVVGEVKPDGSFRLATISGKHRVDGAPEGEYQVTIVPKSKTQSTMPLIAAKPIIVAAGKNELTIEVEKLRTRK